MGLRKGALPDFKKEGEKEFRPKGINTYWRRKMSKGNALLS